VRRIRTELEAQIDDYLLPRLRQMDAPLLMVVGGSTGAGKSTLVNSLVGATVSQAGVLRPTTRAPVLVCHPGDVRWFDGHRILPGLRRATGGGAHAGELELAPTERIAPGLALLDAPDIDSVVAENRRLASQLLAAADAWLFVTTAARYADAVPWDLLAAARERGTALSVVLNRVPADAVDEVSGHLREMLAERGLGDAELLVIRETVLEDGLIPEAELAPVRRRLDELSADAAARTALVRQTLAGALDSLPRRIEVVRTGADDQQAAAAELRAAVERAYEQALDDVDEAVRSGSLLRGEVLARWHDVVGTGDLMRALETRVGWLRDQLRAIVTGKPAADVELKAAVESSVDLVVHAAADQAAERAAAAWRHLPGGRALLDQAPSLDAASPELLERTKAEVRSWQGYVFELVRSEGESKRTTARLASLGVNGAGLTVMLAVFISTGGLTGTELVVAGGTSALSQKVLEAIFGDQAVRELAARARTDLLGRVGRLLEVEASRFLEPLEAAAPAPGETSMLPGALRAIEAAR
jgi:energy-coupling factor transporter ATP-binding protein EcfA2